jgi:CDP-6-deoxy-D-xylo-4-hexulose-3-dehydrase
MKQIRLAEETISREELQLAAEWMTSGAQLTKGSETVAFELEFSKFIGARHAVFVNSGSSANMMMALALVMSGRLKNRRVICPAISWVTTVSPFMLLGFEVILCDADPQNLGLNPRHLAELVEEHDPAVVVTVDVLGHPNSYAEIQQVCAASGAILVEDACEALGTVGLDGRHLGTVGEMGSFSFYYGHHMSTIEGGMVVTDDDELHALLLSMRSHGWSRDLPASVRQRLQEEASVDDFANLYTFYRPGLNFRSTDLQAFIGRGQLRTMAEVAGKRQFLHGQYAAQLRNFWSIASECALLSAFAYGLSVRDRQALGANLLNVGIESRPLICGNIARHPFWYRENRIPELPVADIIHHTGIYLPIHHLLEEGDIARVADAVQLYAVPSTDLLELLP